MNTFAAPLGATYSHPRNRAQVGSRARWGYKHFAPPALTATALLVTLATAFGCLLIANSVVAQTRRRPRPQKPPAQTQAPRGSAARYSTFLHSSDKHKSLECNACHKIPTTWTAGRAFPDAADFPDHDACVRCHRPQFFTRQATIGTGPAICTVCHLRAAPREDRRFAFGKPNSANQTAKPKDERQFRIEFPHDKHQNVIARWPKLQLVWDRSHHRLKSVPQDKKPDYNNCSLCHVTDRMVAIAFVPPQTPDPGLLHPFKSVPRTHDACFECHWRIQQPVGANCGGCHKPSETFAPSMSPKRISAKFAHEGGKGEHILECTTCHINITRARTSQGLTPDVPINACASCHRDSKSTTYPKAVTIETELAQFKKSGTCTYCHTEDVGKKKPPPSHESSVQ